MTATLKPPLGPSSGMVRAADSHRWTIPAMYEYTRIRAFFFVGPRNDGSGAKRIGTDRATVKR
ncbi:hypothetical protein FZ942_22260 [Azospirillum lipoferum]|uniref:Uncharacterized protein n=1 Tax=Azospirillum lipoferum TaxID=193 RepID=A0A5A9GII0_AZOLI|nr:hypothetical protein FZ942_22260 [Azospirillum lipoferum]